MREPGIYRDIPIGQYHGEKQAIGNSGLQQVLDCPALYFGQNLDPSNPANDEEERDSAAQRFGNIVHCSLFEHEAYDRRWIVGPDVHKSTKIWKEFVAGLAPGCEPCTHAERMKGIQARRSALAVPELADALLDPRAFGEASAYWRDEATGVLCKCRPDWVLPVGEKACILFDGKTFSTGDPDEFCRQVPRMGYDVQAAHYSSGFSRASGLQVLAFVFIVVANKWPHAVNLVQLDEDAMASGARKQRRALDIYAHCMKTGEWPAYPGGIKLISLPKYALDTE